MYLLERFGTITLPPGNMTAAMNVVPARTSFVDTAAGVFDHAGDERNRQQFPVSLRYQAMIFEDTPAASRTLEDSLRAAVGTRAKLYRRSRVNDVVHWCTARLVGMPYDTGYEEKRWRNISLEFAQLSRWQGFRYGTGWVLDSGEVFDDGLKLDEPGAWTLNSNPRTVILPHNGNYPISDMQLLVTAKGTPITSITVVCGEQGVSWTWIGTIIPEDDLLIDSGAWSIIHYPFFAYDGFTLNSQHTIEPWMQLAPGSNTYVITRTGGDNTSTAQFMFRDGWA